MLRTSVVPTMFKAGVGANVIPSEAEATLDIRALPDEDITKFYAEMAKIISLKRSRRRSENFRRAGALHFL
jgi:metal-dependent amidase/aminoacylase/carboxypeptidase family protein